MLIGWDILGISIGKNCYIQLYPVKYVENFKGLFESSYYFKKLINFSYVVKASKRRQESLLKRLNDLKNLLPVVTSRQVALVVGSLISMSFILKEKSLLYSRYMQNIINFRGYEDLSWDQKINVNTIISGPKLLEEIEFLEENFILLNTRSLRPRISSHLVMFGDAGERGAGGYLLTKGIKIPFRLPLPLNLQGKSSTERELFATLAGLKSFKAELSNNNVVYITDSQPCDIVCRKGSGKMELHRYAKSIDNFTRENNIMFSTAWVKREQNMEADQLSKVKDPDDWSINVFLFRKIQKLCGWTFSLDPFAANHNAKCLKFYSRYMCPGSAGVNGLLFDWSDEICWVCPPPSLSLQALNHFRSCRARGAFIMPDWGSLPLTPVLQLKEFNNYLVNTWMFPGRLYLDSVDSLFGRNFKGALKVLMFDFKDVM